MATDEEPKKSEADDAESSEEETDTSAQDSTASTEEAKEESSNASSDEAEGDSDEKPSKALARTKKSDDDEAAAAGEALPVATPTQLGNRRFVYAAYLACGISVAFLLTKIIDFAWYKAGMWKPEFFTAIGVEPKDEFIVPLSVIIAVVVAVRYWRNVKVRTMAEEVAEELTKVTWPTREEVINSTGVVILTTIFATVFFALMDQFWLWVTKHVYGS